MGPQAAQAKITSEMTLSEKADAIEEHMMHELDKIVTKSVFANMTDGHVEMEGGAVAQVARRWGGDVPFVNVRCLSDLAGRSSHLDFRAFLPVAARTASAASINVCA